MLWLRAGLDYRRWGEWMRAVIVLTALALFSCDKSPKPEDAVIADAKDGVRAALKDPGSAEFSELYRCGDSRVVTGEVNAKNSFGGYNGNTHFVYADGHVYMEGESDTESYVRANARCSEEIRNTPARIPQVDK